MSRYTEACGPPDQPGLEVDPRQHFGLSDKQVANSEHTSPSPQVVPWLADQQSQANKDDGAVAAAATPQTSLRRRRLYVMLGAGVLALIVILAAVLGGVLGSRAHDTKKDTSSSPTPTSNSSTTPLVNIRPNSPLAVTGYHISDGYSAWLFYQAPDSSIRYSTYLHTQKEWSSPITLSALDSPPSKKTSLATSISLFGVDETPVKLFYIDQGTTIQGQEFANDGSNEQGIPSDFNNSTFAVFPDSRLASYWPWIVSQQSDGSVCQTAKVSWHTYNTTTDTSINLSNESPLTVLPTSTYVMNAAGLVYHGSDEKLTVQFLGLASEDTAYWAWSYGTNLSISIPTTSAMGVFAVGRPDNSNNQTNTYILYQDGNGTIQMVYQDDQSGWKGPQSSDVFDGADNGTDIACLTAAAWAQPGSDLSNSTSMNRCYFQVGGKVKEVYFDGSNWNQGTSIPMT